MVLDDNDMSLTGSLSRSDERYISQGFAVINKNLDQILARMDTFDRKLDANSQRLDGRVANVEDEVSKMETNLGTRITRIETYLKGGAMLFSIVISVLSGIIINNWGALSTPSVPPTTQNR
jgi:hypothetical protein